MEWNGDKQWWLGEHSIELMVPLDFIDTRPCFPQQDIFLWGYAEWSLVFKYLGTFGKIVGSASLVNSISHDLQNSGLYILKILFYLLTYLKIKHRHRFSTFQTCTNLFNQFSQLDVIAVWQPGLAVGYISVTSRSRFAGRVAPAFTESKSIHFHTRFAGRVAPAFTESKSIHFHTNLSGASRNTENLHYKFKTTLPEGVLRNRNKFGTSIYNCYSLKIIIKIFITILSSFKTRIMAILFT